MLHEAPGWQVRALVPIFIDHVTDKNALLRPPTVQVRSGKKEDTSDFSDMMLSCLGLRRSMPSLILMDTGRSVKKTLGDLARRRAFDLFDRSGPSKSSLCSPRKRHLPSVFMLGPSLSLSLSLLHRRPGWEVDRCMMLLLISSQPHCSLLPSDAARNVT